MFRYKRSKALLELYSALTECILAASSGTEIQGCELLVVVYDERTFQIVACLMGLRRIKRKCSGDKARADYLCSGRFGGSALQGWWEVQLIFMYVGVSMQHNKGDV